MLVHKENVVIVIMALAAVVLFFFGASITGMTAIEDPLRLDGKDIVLNVDDIPADSEIVLYVNNNLVSKTKLRDYLDEEGIIYGLLKQAVGTSVVQTLHLEDEVRIPLSNLGYKSNVKKNVRVSVPGSNLFVEGMA